MVKKLNEESEIPEVRAVVGLLPNAIKLLNEESVVFGRLMAW